MAIREWIPSSEHRVQLAPVVRGDNVGALSMVIKMRPRTQRMAIVAREIALHLVHYSFLPAVEHTPGVAHVIADASSSIVEPAKPEARDVLRHPALAGATFTDMPIRTPSYYRALDHPSPLRK